MKIFYVGIKGVIVRGDGKILTLRSNAAQGRRDIWEFPGGRIDGDETIEQALLRELSEELPNIKNVEMHEILDAQRIHRNIDGDNSLVLVFFRVTADFDGDPQISDEHVDWQWVSPDEAEGLVQESNREAIKAVNRG